MCRLPDKTWRTTHFRTETSYAFFVHCGSTGFRPKWTAWYFRHILGVDYHTAKNAIERLIKDYGLLEEGDGGNLVVIVNPRYEGWWQEPSPPVPEMSQLPTITLKVLEEPPRTAQANEIRDGGRATGVDHPNGSEVDGRGDRDAGGGCFVRTSGRTEATDLHIRNRLNWPNAHLADVIKFAEDEW